MFTRTVVLALVVVTIATACSDDGGKQPEESPGPRQAIVEVDGTLRTIEIGNGEVELVGDLPSGDVAVAPDGETVAYVEERRLGGTLFVTTLENFQDAAKAGPGTDPAFSPSGNAVAAMVLNPDYFICPAGTDDPDAEGCRNGERIEIYSLTGIEVTAADTALGENVWQWIGWTEDEQIVAGAIENDYLGLGSRGVAWEDFTRYVGFDPKIVHAVSPTDLMVFHSRGGTPTIQNLDSTSPTPGASVDLPEGATVQDAQWGPDGTLIAAVIDAGDTSEAVSIRPSDRSVEVLDDDADPRGGIVWSADGGWTAFVTGSSITVCEMERDCVSVPAPKGARLLGLR